MPYNILMKRYNGSTWDELYPKTDWANISGKPLVQLEIISMVDTVAKDTLGGSFTWQINTLYFVRFHFGNSVGNITINGVGVYLGANPVNTTTFTLVANSTVLMYYDKTLNRLQITGSYRNFDLTSNKLIVPNELNTLYAKSTSRTDLAHNITATLPTKVKTVRMRTVCYGAGVWVIAGTSGNIEYSTNNGLTWVGLTPFTTGVITSMAYGKGYFMCVDADGKVFKTDNVAGTWTMIYQNTDSVLEAIKYMNGRFILVGSKGFIAFSDDLETFIPAITPSDTLGYTCITYGKDRYITATTTGQIHSSLNGIDWVDVSIPGDTIYYRTCAYGKGTFVLGCQGGVIKYSTDGVNWSVATTNSTSTVAYIREVVYIDGKFFAVMYNSGSPYGEMWTSQDATTWTKFENITDRLWCCACGNDVVIASGDSGIIRRYNLNVNWVSVEPQLGSNEYLWSKTELYLSDGSLITSEVESLSHAKTSGATPFYYVDAIADASPTSEIYFNTLLPQNKYGKYLITLTELYGDELDISMYNGAWGNDIYMKKGTAYENAYIEVVAYEDNTYDYTIKSMPNNYMVFSIISSAYNQSYIGGEVNSNGDYVHSYFKITIKGVSF